MEGPRTRNRARQEAATPDRGTNGRIEEDENDLDDGRDNAENIFVFWPNLIGMSLETYMACFTAHTARLLSHRPRIGLALLHASPPANLLRIVYGVVSS